MNGINEKMPESHECKRQRHYLSCQQTSVSTSKTKACRLLDQSEGMLATMQMIKTITTTQPATEVNLQNQELCLQRHFMPSV